MSYRVSIVVPCYNQGEWLEDCISSIFRSTYQDFEVIVIDDGSTDRATQRIMDTFQHPRVRIIRQANCGVCKTRNRGIEMAVGDFILPIDCDDRISETYIAKAVAILEAHPEVSMVGGGHVFLRGEKISDPVWPLQGGYVTDKIMSINYLPPACVFRKSVWRAVGGYPENMAKWAQEDYDYFLSIYLRFHNIYMLPEVVWYYRQHGMSRNNRQFQRRVSKFLIVWHHIGWYARHPWRVLPLFVWNVFGWMVKSEPFCKEESSHGA